MTAWQVVHVRVNDGCTGRPTPVQIRFSDVQGRFFAPLGRLTQIPAEMGWIYGGQVEHGGLLFATIDGTCEVMLPAGSIRVQVNKGLEYLPLDQVVELAPGKLSLRLTLQRMEDWRQAGWFAGDIRAHDLLPQAALLEGAAEGLSVVQLLARQNGECISNLLAFSGNREAICSEECLVAVNTLNSHAPLGTVALLHSHRPVFPLVAGSPFENWSVLDWCDQCHRKTGMVVWPDLPRLSPEAPQGEALAALLLQKIDVFELATVGNWKSSLESYYRLLDLGLDLPLAGASGKDSGAVPLGALRTYAQLGLESTLEAGTWVDAVRAGRTFVTDGPLLDFRVNDNGPGSRLIVTADERLNITARAISHHPFEELEIVFNGQVLTATSASGQPITASINMMHQAKQSGWLVARTKGTAWAHTSPIRLEVIGQKVAVPKTSLTPWLDLLDQAERWRIKQANQSPDPRFFQQVMSHLQKARDVLVACSLP